MKVYIYTREPVEFGGRTYEPGVHQVSAAEAHALSILGPVRPATVDEIEKLSGRPVVETATEPAPPEAAAPRGKRRRR